MQGIAYPAQRFVDEVVTIAAMQTAGLITPVARFKPVLTYKTAGGCGEGA